VFIYLSTLHDFAQKAKISRTKRASKYLTLKALANLSPGFALKPWKTATFERRHNPEGVASLLANQKKSYFPPGFQSKPWAQISERFQR